LARADAREFQVDEGAGGGLRGDWWARIGEVGLTGPLLRVFSTTLSVGRWRPPPPSLELPSDSMTLAKEPAGSCAYCCWCRPRAEGGAPSLLIESSSRPICEADWEGASDGVVDSIEPW
jgi:hypothetical protein